MSPSFRESAGARELVSLSPTGSPPWARTSFCSPITVNAVNPGATDTGWASPEVTAEVLAHEPQGRWGNPGDAARLIAWLVSDDDCWVTGQVINGTGGGP